MAIPSAQESSEWDNDPAWSRPDPMSAAELEAGLDRVCEQDEGYCQEEPGDFEPFTAEELAEIREAIQMDHPLGPDLHHRTHPVPHLRACVEPCRPAGVCGREASCRGRRRVRCGSARSR
jgi:hypothetical protein